MNSRPVRQPAAEAGLQQNTIRGRRLISALFPELGDIGGVRPDALKWHPQGLALDLMIPGQGGLNDPTTPGGKALGDEINQFIQSNAGALGSDYTMWQQKDHFNHVHANFGASGYPQPGEQYFVPPGLNTAGGGPALGPSPVGGVPTSAAADAASAAQNGVTYDNRIIVQGNSMVDPHQLVPPMQQQMNASTYGRGGMTTSGQGGSLPAVTGGGGG